MEEGGRRKKAIKGGGGEGEGWDKREEEVVGGIMRVDVCIWLIYSGMNGFN